ncbi:MAG: Ig domain-containing protein [Nitrospira sp.]|nr:Ig domain-containing protein [Nitrospira sp.]
MMGMLFKQVMGVAHSRHDFRECNESIATDVHTSSINITRYLLLALGICAVLFSTSCTASSPGAANGSTSGKGNQPPTITSAKILNEPIQLTGPVGVQVDAQDPEREAVSFLYQWYVDNTALAGQTHATLSAEMLSRGQSVFVEIIPSDGVNKGHPYRAKSIEVGNTSPKVVAILLTPQAARSGDKIEAVVEASDPDHDRVDLTYKWYRNETAIKEGEESFLDTTGFVAHDKIMVEVTAHDPAVTGNSLKSEPLVFGNSAPRIVSTPPISDSQDRFDYTVKAMDPDGDRVIYYLEAAPTGMSINETSGHILWQIPSDQEGIFHIKVAAKDGYGGMATQEFDLTLTSTGPAKPSGT